MVKRLAVLILCFSLLCAPVRATQNEKLIALTFDDGPSGRFTRKLLEGLEERNAKADNEVLTTDIRKPLFLIGLISVFTVYFFFIILVVMVVREKKVP